MLKQELSLPFEFADVKPCDKSFLNATVNNIKYDWELKRDGTALMIHTDNNYVRLYGRGILQDGSVSNYTDKFPEITNAFKKMNLKDTIFVGELCVMEGMLEQFKYLQTRTTRKHDIADYIALYPSKALLFDILRYRHKDISMIPYADRREILQYLPNYNCFNSERIGFISKQIKPKSKVQLWHFVEKYKREGIVIKDKTAPHGEGIFKYKRFETQEVWVTGYKEGTGRLKEMGLIGALKISQYDVNGKVVDCGRVGSGLNDEVRKLINPIVRHPNHDKNPLIIEVKYNELTADGKFRHPRFLRIRTDKSKEQCVRK